MELRNEFTVPAPVSEVWKTLLDVEQIAPCLPGATVDRVEGDEVAGRVKVKVGPITASYAGSARFVTKDESEHRFVLEGSGRETRGSGSASATVETRMSEQGSATQVIVDTNLQISGKQAQFGRGMLADVAGKLTDQFAACLAERVRGPAEGTRQPDAQAGAPTTAAPRTGESEAVSQAGSATPEASGALDLVSTIAMPAAKQAAPVLAGVMIGLVLGLLLRRRRSVPIMAAGAPGLPAQAGVVPATQPMAWRYS
jgi:hypothetical protein